MREGIKHSFTASCSCGAWFRREAMGTDLPPEAEQFLHEHADHCRCVYPRHPPHIGITPVRS